MEFQSENMQTVKQIATERPIADSGLQVTVRGGDHRTSARNARVPPTFKLMLLQNTQEGNLGLGWKFSDLSRKSVPPFANSNLPKRC
jgi:hypothetical protein